MKNHELLFAQDLSLSSAGINRLDRFRILLQQGELTALIGINGSGKTILGEILAGQRQPDSGSLYLDGKLADSRLLQSTVALISQNDHLIDNLTVTANLFISRSILSGGPIYRPQQSRQIVRDLLGQYQLEDWTDSTVRQIPHSVQHLLLIIRAVIRGSRLIILNNITANYGDSELVLLGQCLQRITGHQTTVLLMSNNWNRIFEQARHTMIIRNGRNIKTFWGQRPSAAEVAVHVTDTTRTVPAPQDQEPPRPDLPDFTPRRLNGRTPLNVLGRTFEPGLITGLLDTDDSKDGLIQAFISELRQSDRQDLVIIDSYAITDEFIGSMTLLENCLILLRPSLHRWHGLVNREYNLVIADEIERKLGIAKRYFDLPITALPRPERFKLLLFALRFRNPSMLLFDNLTIYSDESEKKMMLAELAQLAAENYRIVLISTDLSELKKCCPVIWPIVKGTLPEEDQPS